MLAASETAYKTIFYTKLAHFGYASVSSSRHPRSAGEGVGKRMVGASHIAAASVARSNYVLLAE